MGTKNHTKKVFALCAYVLTNWTCMCTLQHNNINLWSIHLSAHREKLIERSLVSALSPQGEQ